MKTSTIILASAAASLAGGPAQAASIYETGVLTFETQQRQSSWGTGDAARFEKTARIGSSIASSDSTTASAGTYIPAVTVPNPLWGAWWTCKNTIDFRCGDEPSKSITETPAIDTRVSATLSARTSGYLGADLGFVADAGSVAATVQHQGTAWVPDPGEVAVGEYFNFNPAEDWIAGELDNQSPTVQASVTGLADVKLDVRLETSGPTGTGDTGWRTVVDTGANEAELVYVDPKEMRFMEGIFGPVADLQRDLAKVEASAQVVVGSLGFSPKLVLEFLGGSRVTVGDPASVGIEVAKGSIEVPVVAETAMLQPGQSQLTLTSDDDFIGVKADLDAMLTALGTPPAGITTDVGPMNLKIDGFDAKVGPELDAFQDLVLKSELHVDLMFDRAVLIDGLGEQTGWSGLWKDLPDMAVLGETVFTPVFSTVATLTNRTGVELDFTFVAKLFELTAGLGLPLLPELKVGPLFEKEILLGDDLVSFSFFDDTFRLAGFNSFDGQAFTVAPGAVSAVPLPGSLAFFGGAAFALGLIGRRPRRQA